MGRTTAKKYDPLKIHGVASDKREVLKNIAAHVGTSQGAIVRNGLHLIFAQYPPEYQKPKLS